MEVWCEFPVAGTRKMSFCKGGEGLSGVFALIYRVPTKIQFNLAILNYGNLHEKLFSLCYKVTAFCLGWRNVLKQILFPIVYDGSDLVFSKGHH